MPVQVQCSSCGKWWSVQDNTRGGQVTCPGCQAPIQVPAQPAAAAPQPGGAGLGVRPPEETSGMAITALVLAIVPLCVTQIIAPILGIVALFRIGSSRGRLKGSGLAIASLVVTGCYVVMLAVPAAMLLPALSGAREEARKAVCRSNLKQIGLAMSMYMADYDEWYPAGQETSLGNLALLHDQYIMSKRIFKCPSTTDTPELAQVDPTTGQLTLTRDTCSYEYVLVSPLSDPDTIIAFDKAENHSDTGRNVLLFDCAVVWMPEGEFQQEIESQKARWLPPTGPLPK